MASLKEIKGRIGSVEGTLKITSAMKMVASAKLHKAQQAIESMLPYDRQLTRIMTSLLQDGTAVSSPLSQEHAAVRSVAIVAIASNSSLCGGYNSNMVRHATAVIREYAAAAASGKAGLAARVAVYVIGRKLDQALQKLQKGKNAVAFDLVRDYVELGDNPKFETAQSLSQRLMDDYEAGRIDRAELLYMHFKSTASQVPTRSRFLPLALDGVATAAVHSETRYIVEPSPTEVLNALVPDALRMKVYTAMLDAQAAEHAARTVAMQTATDNANELLDELRLAYNKGRQAAITAELLDIVGGSIQ